MRFTQPVVAIATVTALLGVAGCGDDDETARSTTASTSTGAATETGGETTEPAGKPVDTVDVSETEYALDPADAKVSKSGVIEFNAYNDGKIDHALEIEGPDGDSETETIAPGDSSSVSVDLPPGEYTWYCPIANHRELGMEGTITVAGGSGGASTEPGATTGEPSTGTDSTESGGGGGGY